VKVQSVKRLVQCILLLALVLSGCTPDAVENLHSGEPSDTTALYRDPEMGWTWSYPQNWRIQRFGDFLGRTFIRGALVSNVHRSFHHPDCGSNCSTSSWDFSSAPSDVVMVEFHCSIGGPVIGPNGPDTRFPLSFDRLRRTTDKPPYGAPEPRLWLPIQIGTTGFVVNVWLGRDASDAARAATEDIVDSITEPKAGCMVD
jgi:hypothetical protein